MGDRGTVYVGVDPDVARNGVARLGGDGRIDIRLLSFAEAVEYVVGEHRRCVDGRGDLLAVIEAGWFNKGNYHLSRWDGKQASAAKGVAVGRNFEVGMLMGEMLGHAGVPFEFVRPLRKRWAGKDRKITQAELEEVTGQRLPRTNQEGRDAALLAWVRAGMPVPLRQGTL